MDVFWVVLDSLSFSATPFGPNGPKTMPKLESLADECGTVFTNAYVPGPSSPSSHAAFFTGKRPSVVGMHEAHPHYDGKFPTVASALADTHQSLLISTNPYLFNGLQRDFDSADDLRRQQYLLFDSATDPEVFLENADTDSKLLRYIEFCASQGTPIRSLLNGLQYKFWKRRQNASIPASASKDEIKYQHANTINDRIREFVSTNTDAFVVANYMDIHPPLDASSEALERLAPDIPKDELPIGVPGQDVYERIQAGDDSVGAKMYNLLQAAIWDTDRKVTPLIREFVEDGAFVVVTADHGIWFRRDRELDEERLHVPLVLFHPDEPSRTVETTVNIRSLPTTTMSALEDNRKLFEGSSLLDVKENRVSITEFIHEEQSDSKPISPHGTEAGQIKYDIVAIEGETRVDFVDDSLDTVRGEPDSARRLRDIILELREENPRFGSEELIEYDEEVRQRLEDLGYL